MIDNLSLNEFKEVLLLSVKSMDIDTQEDKDKYIKIIKYSNSKEKCLKAYNDYKNSEDIDNETLLSDYKKQEQETPKEHNIFKKILRRW